jgi:hypothetical protein
MAPSITMAPGSVQSAGARFCCARRSYDWQCAGSDSSEKGTEKSSPRQVHICSGSKLKSAAQFTSRNHAAL